MLLFVFRASCSYFSHYSFGCLWVNTAPLKMIGGAIFYGESVLASFLVRAVFAGFLEGVWPKRGDNLQPLLLIREINKGDKRR